MWVLEARENAEKVWYPVIWEEKKDASNVIDYDIHEEITKDTSAVINANNDTTTGMANVIPWINAPKLIASTSIIWSLWWGWWEWGSAWANLSAWVYIHTDYAQTITSETRSFSISSEVWDLQFTQWANWIIIPKTATYYLKVYYPKWLSMWQITTDIMQDNESVHTYVWPQSSDGEQSDFFFASLTKGKSLWAKYTITTTGNITWNRAISIDIQSIT